MKYFGIHQVGNNFLIAILSSRLKPLFLYQDSSDKKLSFSKKFLFQRKKVISGLKTNDVIIKESSLQIRGSSIVKKALTLQSKTLFPFDDNPSVIIPLLTCSKNGQKDYLLYGTTVSKINKKISNLEEKRVSPYALSFEAMALGRFASAYFSSYKLSFIIHIEENKTICVFLKNEYPVFSHTIRTGKNELLQDINPDNILDLELIDESKNDQLTKRWIQFKVEITKIFLSLKCEEKIFVMIVGTIENATNLEKFLFSDVADNILFFNSPKISNTDYNKLRKYAIPIGYCIDAIKTDNKSLQFIQKNCLPTKVFSSILKKAFYISLLSLSLFFISFRIQSKRGDIKSKAITEKFNALMAIDKKVMNREINLENYSSLSEKLDGFQKAIIKEKKIIPYFFKKEYPRHLIAEILELQKSTTIKSFHYSVKSHPTVKKPYDKTVVKVTLKVSGSDDDINSFKTNLFEKPFVNQKLKTNHSYENNLHKISFYLK